TTGGTSNAQTFTVQAPPAQPPTLTNVQPNFGVAGNAVGVTLTGTNFVAGATTVVVSGTGITVGTPNVTGPTSLTVTLTIAANAATTARNVTVTTTGGTSNPQTFTVQAPQAQPPTLTNVQPNTGVAGNAV